VRQAACLAMSRAAGTTVAHRGHAEEVGARAQGATPCHHAMAAGAPRLEVGSGWGKEARGGEAAPSGCHGRAPRPHRTGRRGRAPHRATLRTGEAGTGPSRTRGGRFARVGVRAPWPRRARAGQAGGHAAPRGGGSGEPGQGPRAPTELQVARHGRAGPSSKLRHRHRGREMGRRGWGRGDGASSP
jgi:hypothetical protein